MVTASDSYSTPDDDSELSPFERDALIRRVTLRLIPFLFLLYIVAYLDRVNVTIAQLQMQPALHFTNTVYGVGSGIFFIGYFFFEVPSNLMLARVGAKRWIARIMITWGLIAMLMSLTWNPASFFVFRFLLGIGEAGFFPGVILYLTFWFTRVERARIVALFMTATVLANVIGAPISGKLLNIHWLHLPGWKWLFILEGIPAVLLAFAVLAYLPNGPADAPWLSAPERSWLLGRLTEEDKTVGGHVHGVADVLKHPRVLHMSLLYLAIVISNYGYTFWFPKIIQSFSTNLHVLSDTQVSWLSIIPYVLAVIGMVLIGHHSDLRSERRLHVAFCSLLGCGGLALGALNLQSPILCVTFLSIAAVGMWGTLGPFWGLSTAFIAGTGAAGAIALINSIGNLGGFIGPFIMGYLKDHTPGYTAGLLTLAFSSFCAAMLAFSTRKE